MAQSIVLEWLNENSLRSFPLRLTTGKELIVAGLGAVSFGAYNSTVGGYLVSGATDSSGAKSSFLTQIAVGDLIEVQGIRSEVLRTPRVTDMTNRALYIKTAISLPATIYSYNIVKKATSLDNQDQPNFNFDGVFLDANLVYRGVNDRSQVGRLLSFTPSGVGIHAALTVEVYGIPTFTVPDYKNASYPYYARNSDDSLLVFGEATKKIQTSLSFVNQYFEPSTINQLNDAWKGLEFIYCGVAPLTGDVTFSEGYQISLSPNEQTRTLKIAAGRSEGTPIGCERIYGEDVDADCGSIISSINSAVARTDFGSLDLEGGPHVSIYPDIDRHRIYVGLSFDKPDICTTIPARPVTQI